MSLLTSFIVQIIAEFFPISSTLFLKTLQLDGGEIFHIFSGILFLIIYRKHIFHLIFYPIKNLNFICAYILSVIPSTIIGLLTDYYQVLNLNLSFRLQVGINIISAILLYIVVSLHKKKNLHHFNKNHKKVLSIPDGLMLGILTSLNGFLPGMSRLGMSLIYLLLKNYDIHQAYALSLITSIPVLCGKPIVHMILNQNIFSELLSFINHHFIIILVVVLITILFHKYCLQWINQQFLKAFLVLRIVYFIIILCVSFDVYSPLYY